MYEQLSQHVEDLLVERNLRGMKTVQAVLKPGYCLRAAELISNAKGHVLIGTGFPVNNTFETDGPAGAIALYGVMEKLGTTPIMVCGTPLAEALAEDYRTEKIPVGDTLNESAQAKTILSRYQPSLLIAIECPGQAEDGNYYNMRGKNINQDCARFDAFVKLADCPTIGIGDGGNEIGMGNISEALTKLDIIPSTTCCQELVVADVSNWAAYGLIALLSKIHEPDFLAECDSRKFLSYLSMHGSADGVTGENTLTEDGLPLSEGQALINRLKSVTGY